MTIRLIDANNQLRVRLCTGTGLREIVQEVDGQQRCPSGDIDILVWDGAGANRRRRALYPPYKMQRRPASEDVLASLELLGRLLPYTRAWQARAEGWEADDVIAHLSSRLPSSVLIVSNDFDFFQLHDPPRVVAGCTPKADVRPDEVRLFKTLVGDRGDNVPGIPGFGPKAWEKCDRDLFLRLVQGEEIVVDGVPPRVRTWLDSPDNRRLLRTMWQVVGFFPVPEDAESVAFSGSSAARAGPRSWSGSSRNSSSD